MAYTPVTPIVFGAEATTAPLNQIIANQVDHEARIVGITGNVGTISMVATSQSTNAVGPVDLATVGPSISLTIGASGKAHIQYSVMSIPTALGVAGRNFAFLNLDITGATTATSAFWNTGINNESAWTGSGIHHSFLVTGLNPGVTVFKLRYGATGGTYSFYNRQISGYAIY